MSRRPQIRTRLDGDDLYEWARMMTEIELIRRRVEQVGQAWLRTHGFPLEGTTITNDGYVVVTTEDDAENGSDDGSAVREALGWAVNRAGTTPDES